MFLTVLTAFALVATTLQLLPDHPCGPKLPPTTTQGSTTTGIPTSSPLDLKLCNRTFVGYAPTPARPNPSNIPGEVSNWDGWLLASAHKDEYGQSGCWTKCIEQATCAFVYYNSTGGYCGLFSKFWKQDFATGGSVPATDMVYFKSYLNDANCAASIPDLVKSEVTQFYPEGGVFKLTPLDGDNFSYAGNSPDGKMKNLSE